MILNDTMIPTRYCSLSNGIKLAYTDEGSGEDTLLFIHGLGNYSGSWIKNTEALKQHFRCIAIDLPGNGYSSRVQQQYTLNFFAGCIFDFILQMQLQDITLVGHSMGGQIACNLLINAPQTAKKLVLCAPAGFEKFTPWEVVLYKNSIQFLENFSTEENNIRKAIQSSFYLNIHQGDELIRELISIIKKYPLTQYRSMIEDCTNAMLDEPVFDKLHLIQQETLVLFGERDALIPNRLLHPVTTRHIAEKGCEQMPNASLQMLQQCGHFIHWEKASLVNSAIKNFVS